MATMSSSLPLLPTETSPGSTINSDTPKKTGRPNKWTASRQRKLARLYLNTFLSPKDIRKALREEGEEEEDHWAPGPESINKTINSLLNDQPRWLRPKNKADMDLRIAGLSECQKQRKIRWNIFPTQEREQPSPQANDLGLIFAPSFSETPLADLFQFTPQQEPQWSILVPPDLVYSYSRQNFSTTAESQYSFQDIARGARGITYYGFYQCPICNGVNTHTNSAFDQMKCAVANNRDRNSSDSWGMTPAHALVTYHRVNNDAEQTPETPEQTAELFRILFPRDDPVFRQAIYTLDPLGNNLFPSLALRGLTAVIEYFMKLMNQAPSPSAANPMARIDEERVSIYVSTSSLKHRLPQHSSSILKNVARLLKCFSVSDSSALTTRPRSDFPLSLLTAKLLPDAFLKLDRHVQQQGICLPGFKTHDSGACWCHVVRNLDSKVWVSGTGLVNHLVKDPPQSLTNLDLDFRDAFGNGLLHMLVARDAELDIIFDALENGVDGNAKNTAGQSFLHLFSPRLLQSWAEDRHRLLQIIQRLNSFNVAFFDCDIFGSHFFHRLTRNARNLNRHCLQSLDFLGIQLPRERDAFGWVATTNPTPKGINKIEKVLDSEGHVPLATPKYALDLKHTPLATPEDILALKHAGFLAIARGAVFEPSLEDLEGRNGLQCLAEVMLTISSGTDTAKTTRSCKIGQLDLYNTSQRLDLRYDLVRDLISASVHLNHYDKNGKTVLMAFAAHLQDGEDDKTLAKILNHLIESGADVNRRSGQGETALHIAVKLGHKVATKVLLDHGANVHARTADGKGVLALGEVHYIKAREDPPLYASIMACMVLACQYGAVAAPTLAQEWLLRDTHIVS